MTFSQNTETSDANVETKNTMEEVSVKDAITGNTGDQTIEIKSKDTTQKAMLKLERDSHKVIYTSSYDRGLEWLLKMWSDVKKEVPGVTLEICYGWQLFDQFYKNNPSSMSWKARMEEMMKYEGITHHGRLPQKQLAELMKTCGIWSFPTHFGEINCISAIKAQAYGCEPVVVNYAALKETVQFGRKVEGDIYDQETQDEFKKQLIDALKNPMGEEKRQEMMKWAWDKYKWEKIAISWDEEFRKGGKNE